MEEILYEYVNKLWIEKKLVSRIIVFRESIKILLLFKGGINYNPNWFKDMKQWFYYGFFKRYNLSYTRISGASRKLPPDCKLKHESIIRRVAKSQTPRKVNYTVITAVEDKIMMNTDHIPMYRDMASSYSWAQKGAGGGQKKNYRGQIATAGGEKDRFTGQVSCNKSGGKIIPFIIFKAKPPNGVREFQSNTVSYELKHRLPDSSGNEYPPEEKVYLTCNDTVNSNGEFTKMILEQVIFPELSVFEGKRSAILVDDFRGHSHSVVKEYVKQFKSGDEHDDDEARYDIVDFHIMAGGITPKAQPIDMILGKVFKGAYKDLYDSYMLTAPTRNGHPITPSRQLCAKWAVHAWDAIPESLIKKSWELAQYKTMEEIENEKNSMAIVNVSQQDIVNEILPVANESLVLNYQIPDNVYGGENNFDDSNVVHDIFY